MWAVDGVSLDTLAYNVDIVPQGVGFPGRRGDNIKIPYAAGARYVPKKPISERPITLSMWVRGTNAEGVPQAEPEVIRQQHLDMLLQLFGQEREVTLTRTMPDGSTRTIQAEARSHFWLTPSGTQVVRFVVNLLAADPLFYGAGVNDEKVITLVEHAHVLVNPGTATTRGITITVAGVTEALMVENTTTDVWVRYGGSTGAGDSLEIQSPRNNAELNGGNVVGLISHAGDPAFMVLAPGENELVITSAAAPTATVTFSFYAPYF